MVYFLNKVQLIWEKRKRITNIKSGIKVIICLERENELQQIYVRKQKNWQIPLMSLNPGKNTISIN